MWYLLDLDFLGWFGVNNLLILFAYKTLTVNEKWYYTTKACET